MISIADQQYRAAAEAAAAVITGIRCYYSSKYHTGTWYVQHNTDHYTAVLSVRIRM